MIAWTGWLGGDLARLLRRAGARCGAPATLPRELAWVFWADAVLLAAMVGAAGAAGKSSALHVAAFGVNLVALVASWLTLPRPGGLPGAAPSGGGNPGTAPFGHRRPAASLVFLLTTLTLGTTGTSGEQVPATLVALTVLAMTWGRRASAAAMVLIDGAGLVLEQEVYHVAAATSLIRALLFAAAQVFVLAMVSTLERARWAEAHAVRLNERLRELTIAEERGRMAGEMHDTVGHQLMVVTLDLQNALRLRARDEEAGWQMVAQARDAVAVAVQHVRRAVRALRPVDLAGQGLEEALTGLAATFEGTGMSVTVAIDGDPCAMPATQQVLVLRAVREGLLNAARHAAAERVTVSLSCSGDVQLSVTDNGTGAPTDRLAGGFGLRELASRVEAQQGVLQVDGAHGVRLSLRLPAAARTAPAAVPGTAASARAIR